MVLETIADQLNISPALLVILIIWAIFWKGMALWKSARLNQLVWFIALLVINTFGILEIIYLIIYSKYSVSPSKKKRK